MGILLHCDAKIAGNNNSDILFPENFDEVFIRPRPRTDEKSYILERQTNGFISPFLWY